MNETYFGGGYGYNNDSYDYPRYPQGYRFTPNTPYTTTSRSSVIKRTGFFQGNQYDIAYCTERMNALFEILSVKEAQLLADVNYASDIEDIIAMRDALNKCIDIIQKTDKRIEERDRFVYFPCDPLDPRHKSSKPGADKDTTATPVPPVSPVKIGDDLDHEPIVTCQIHDNISTGGDK